MKNSLDRPVISGAYGDANLEEEGTELPRFNPSRMNEIAEQAGSDAIVHELVSLFRDDVEKRLTELKAAAASADRTQRERIAHSIKGACANLGAELMASLAKTLERCAEDAAPALAEQLIREFAELTKQLDARYRT